MSLGLEVMALMIIIAVLAIYLSVCVLTDNISITAYIVIIVLITAGFIAFLAVDFLMRHARLTNIRHIKNVPTDLRRQIFLFNGGPPPQWRLLPQHDVTAPSIVFPHRMSIFEEDALSLVSRGEGMLLVQKKMALQYI